MSDELKSCFTQEISASAFDVRTSINNLMNRKFDQLAIKTIQTDESN